MKALTLVLIEQGSKARWGIEFWITEKVNGSIHADKGDESHISDHAVVLNGLNTHIGDSSPAAASSDDRFVNHES